MLVNCMCICKDLLSSGGKLYMIMPCNHIIHKKCIKDNHIHIHKCVYCNTSITGILTLTDIKRNIGIYPGYHQLYIDMMSVYCGPSKTLSTYTSAINHILQLTNTYYALKNYSGPQDLSYLYQRIMSTLNIKVIIKNKNKLPKQPVVYIANHNTFLDPLVVFGALKCGFVAALKVMELKMYDHILRDCPLVIVNRSKPNSGTVKRITGFLQTKGSICVFPEGTRTHEKTLGEFRTGAFHTGYPVVPLVLSFDPLMYSGDPIHYVLNILANGGMTVTITVLDIEYGPFSPSKIGEIRRNMSLVGNFALSRVSNRDLVN